MQIDELITYQFLFLLQSFIQTTLSIYICLKVGTNISSHGFLISNPLALLLFCQPGLPTGLPTGLHRTLLYVGNHL